MKLNYFLITFMICLLMIESCSSDQDEAPDPQNQLTVNDFFISVDDGLNNGDVIGTIDASTTFGSLTFSILSQNPAGAIAVDENTGTVSVNDESSFVFTENDQVTATIEVANDTETKSVSLIININEPRFLNAIFWTGPTTTFRKENNADPTEASNQDRITDNVWITRGNEGGRIYNIKIESVANQVVSPADTEWARGTIANIENLTFDTFNEVVSPKNDVNRDFVMHLITDDIYIDVRFTDWTVGSMNGGGFTYERSTPE